MEDMYDQHDKNTCSSSTSPPSSSSSPQDEISLFLHQIMLRSTSSSSSLMTHVGKNAQNSTAGGLGSSNTAHENAYPLYGSSLFRDRISAVESAAVVVSTSAGGFMSSSANVKGSSAANVSSSSVGVSENETDEYDCESEEGAEALAEEVPAKSVPQRSSSKRSRAAEVHNLSEKRRRSRINEKMKALQNLIPNSNKTDKASMLDEAIEYLKQLQLQVQMLSMRNGLSLHPMCFPEGLQPLQLPRMRMEFGEENRSMPLNMTAALPLHQENPLDYASSLPNKHSAPDQPSFPSPPYIINSDTSFGLDSSILAHIRPFQLRRSSEICRDDILQLQQLNASLSDANPLGVTQELGSGTMASVSLSFDMQTSELKDSDHLETCIAGRDQTGMVIRNSEHNVVLASPLSSFSPDSRLEKVPAMTTSRQRNQVSEACQASNRNPF